MLVDSPRCRTWRVERYIQFGCAHVLFYLLFGCVCPSVDLVHVDKGTYILEIRELQNQIVIKIIYLVGAELLFFRCGLLIVTDHI